MTNINIESCRALLGWMKEHTKKIVILTHANPDGDALGSSLGLHCVLQNAGYASTVIFPTGFPQVLHGISDYDNWVIFENNENIVNQMIGEADLFFMLDFNDIKRIGKVRKSVEQLGTQVVLIDHHPQPLIDTPFLFSDTKVSSTAELVYDFVIKMGWKEHLNALAANAMLTGIIADTASFSHNARRPELYKVVAELITAGADQSKIQEALFSANSEDRLRLLGHALSEKMETFPQYHTAVISLSKDELKKYSFKIGDTEGFVNYPLSIKGIIFSCFLMDDGEKIKISFRSKGGFAVNEFSANHFQGGGHLNAAGGESRRSLKETLAEFIALLPKYAEVLDSESKKQL